MTFLLDTAMSGYCKGYYHMQTYNWIIFSTSQIFDTRMSEAGIKPGTSELKPIALSTDPRKNPKYHL